VIEKTIPWWRKALKFALGGIRSGFGLFPRAAKTEAVREEEITQNSEESLEIETALTKPSPQHEVPAETVIQPEPAAEPVPAVELAPAIEPVLTLDLPVHPADPISAVPELESTEAVVPIAEAVAVDEALPKPVIEAEAEPEAAPIASFTLEKEVEIEPVLEPEQDAHAEPGAVSEPAPEPTEALDPVAEAEAEDESVSELVVVAEAEIETARTPEITVDSERAPEAATEVESAECEALVEPETEARNEPVSEPVEEVQAEPEAEPKIAESLVAESELEGVIETVPETIELAEPVEETVIINEIAEKSPEDAEAEAETAPTLGAFVDSEPALEAAADSEFTECEALAEAETEVKNEPVFEPVEEAQAEPESVSEPAPESVETVAQIAETVIDSEPTPEPVENTEAIAEATSESHADGESAEPEAPVENRVPHLVLTPEPTAEEAAVEKADEKAAAKFAARQKKLDEGSEQSPFSVLVGQVYDGPLDLLLDLIRKQDIDIYDIPIAKITAQFLAYVNQLKSSDMDVAGEFIYTASLLIHIKSKMLLPRSAAEGEDASEDPRRELVERLLEHERFKNAAQMLQQKQMLEAATWSNPGASEFKDDAAAEPEIAADTVDLVRIFRDILERARKRPAFNVEEDSVTVGQMIQFLARRLTMEDKPVALRKLLSHTRSERALIAMFLALLELVRMQAILLRQDRAFSEIFVKKHTGFDTVMSEGLVNTHDDWR